MNTITNRQAVCDVLTSRADSDRDIVALFSDSRGSSSMGGFIKAHPQQVYEIGIAEQDLVGISAGLAASGKKPFAFSPASFLASRSYEQVKIDVAYSHTNVKLIGISGGVSYGALGMSHHSVQDIAAMASIPRIRVYLPCDRFETAFLINRLLDDSEPAYVRVSRNASPDVYAEGSFPGAMDRAFVLREGTDVGIIACGETVRPALDAADLLAAEGISARVVDMFCVKPLDTAAIAETARRTGCLVTAEEHVRIGGLGSMVAQAVCEACPCPVLPVALPDSELVTGSPAEVFHQYGLDAEGIARAARESVKKKHG